MARDSSGLSPLHYATERGFHECATVMQRYGGSGAAQRPVLNGPGAAVERPGTGLRRSSAGTRRDFDPRKTV